VHASLRGACKPGTQPVTSALRDAVRDDARTAQEFLTPDHEDAP
jgi:hypothetical protein